MTELKTLSAWAHCLDGVELSIARVGVVCAAFVFGASPAASQTVLERVLEQIVVSGLFVNAAQSGFGQIPQRINASITNIFDDGRLPGADTFNVFARPPPTLTMGNLNAMALGATNAGELIMSLTATSPRTVDMPDISAGTGIIPAMTAVFGENHSFQLQTDLAQINDLVAMSQRMSMEVSQVGSGSGATSAALNLAANEGSIDAAILNRIDGAIFNAMDMTTTTIGAVNAGLVQIVGDQ